MCSGPFLLRSGHFKRVMFVVGVDFEVLHFPATLESNTWWQQAGEYIKELVGDQIFPMDDGFPSIARLGVASGVRRKFGRGPLDSRFGSCMGHFQHLHETPEN